MRLLALLLTLALCASGAFATSSLGDSPPLHEHPWLEFSAVAHASHDPTGDYVLRVQSLLEVEPADLSVVSWDMAAEVDLSPEHNEGERVRHVYHEERLWAGRVNAETGEFEPTTCESTHRSQFLDKEGSSFVPELVDAAKVGSSHGEAAVECSRESGCRVWTLRVGSSRFNVYERNWRPFLIVSENQRFEVVSFELNVARDARGAVDRSLLQTDLSALSHDMCKPLYTHEQGYLYPGHPDFEDDEVQVPTFELPEASNHSRRVVGPRNSPIFRLEHKINYDQFDDAVVGEAAGECRESDVGDGFCDAACNVPKHKFDGGDCCRGTCDDTATPYACGSNGYTCVTRSRRFRVQGALAFKRCGFLHGAGRDGAYPPRMTSSRVGPTSTTKFLFVKYYWGDWSKYMQGICDSIIYIDANTKDYGWDDATLMNVYYSQALSIYNQGGVLFCHSMCNNIMAGACMLQGKCGAKVYSVQGPTRGTQAASSADAVLQLFGSGAKGSTETLRNEYRGHKSASTSRELLARTAASRGLWKGVLCGKSGLGSGGVIGVGLAAINTIVYGVFPPWHDADGLVGLDDCRLYRDSRGTLRMYGSFSGSATSRYYEADANHFDGTGYNGDFRRAQPVTWYKTMARNG